MGRIANYVPKDKNCVTLGGIVKSELNFIAEFNGTKIYETELEVSRLSGNVDLLHIFISDRMENFSSVLVGNFLKIEGNIRSSQYRDETGKRRSKIYVNTRRIVDVNDCSVGCIHENNVELEGVLYKKPLLRKTKTNVVKVTNGDPVKGDIAELMLLVSNGYGKYEHIPVIVWSQNAKYISSFDEGTKVSVTGRFQSRRYLKHIGDEIKELVAYEVSASTVEVLDSDGGN